ncbi:hypothetical protein RJ639_028594 [Escallonia herrerae]|uniref:Uncharacterized protein n=1 Tax=Escallonia herrerae TaxID=1293975 RepID=A0AA88X3C4_9ASTE|nr:hypothetical protein RJ639_028594 [Escallonia herrerae]
MQSKSVACEGEQQNCDEVDKVEAALDALKCHSNVTQMQNALELSFQEIEEELDSVLRCLIRIRRMQEPSICQEDGSIALLSLEDERNMGMFLNFRHTARFNQST